MTTIPLNPIANHFFVVTGSIGTGKSTVCRLLGQNLDVVVIDADHLAREAVTLGSEGLEKIVSTFGKSVLAQDGSLDRKALGTVVFADKQKKQQLEDILHPAIRNLFDKKLISIPKTSDVAPLIFYDIPLYFEVNYHHPQCRGVIVVSASAQTSIQRIMKRDSLTIEEAKARLDAQIPIEQKVAKADFVITNDHDGDLTEQVSRLIEWCKNQRAM